MANTAVALAQDALLSVLQGVTYPAPPVAVTLGQPTTFMNDHIVLSGQVTAWESDAPFSGGTAAFEQFTLTVYVHVTRLTNDYKAVRDRAFVLGDAVVAALRGNVMLNGKVMQARAGSFDLSESVVDERHREVTLQIDVRCQAHVP